MTSLPHDKRDRVGLVRGRSSNSQSERVRWITITKTVRQWRMRVLERCGLAFATIEPDLDRT